MKKLTDMQNIDNFELEILELFEKNELKSVSTKDKLEKFKMAARVTAIKNVAGQLIDVKTNQ